MPVPKQYPTPELFSSWQDWAHALLEVLTRESEPDPTQLVLRGVAGLPPPIQPGILLFITDDAAQVQPAFSDGSNWKRVVDGTTVA